MHGLLAALGNAAHTDGFRAVEAAWTQPPFRAHLHTLSGPGFRVSVSRPPDCQRPVRAVSPDGNVTVLVDGYLLTNLLPETASPAKHLDSFAAAISTEGLTGALRHLIIATFAMAVHDARSQRLYLLSDPLTLVPLYHGKTVSGGYLAATRPAALAESGLLDTSPDYIGIAEWLYTAAPFGARTALKSLSFLRPESILEWDTAAGEQREISWPDPLFQIEPDDSLRPRPEELTAAFQRSCRRHAALGGRVAQLMSAGLDSRFILAHWPTQPLPCFTYGVPGSTEVEIARRAAAVAGSSFHHVPTPVECFLDSSDAIFRLTGGGVFYTRYAAASAIRDAAYDTLLDGFYGDVFFGGSYYTNLPGQSLTRHLQSLLTIHHDSQVTPDRYDELAEDLLKRVWVERPLHRFCSAEFSQHVTNLRAEMLDDIHRTLCRLRPSGGSLSALVRNSKLQDRGSRFTAQQGVLCRGHVEVYYPFIGDLEQLRLALRLPPRSIAYNRLYVPMFRASAPRLARVVSGHSLLPLGTSPVVQRLFETTLTRFKLHDRWARLSVGGSTNWDTWPAWFAQPVMQEYIESELTRSAIADSATLEATFSGIRAGRAVNTGVVFHLLAIARWLRMPGPHGA